MLKGLVLGGIKVIKNLGSYEQGKVRVIYRFLSNGGMMLMLFYAESDVF
jgi:hypothetical protein